jgi:hypothetical protein
MKKKMFIRKYGDSECPEGRTSKLVVVDSWEFLGRT